jgi:hypothetical protein
MSTSSENGLGDSIQHSARRVAGTIGETVGQAKQAACQAGDGIGELRRVIRAQPLTMGFLAIGIGYLLGTLASRAGGR